MSDPRTRHCKKCGEPVIFLSTKTKPIDIDADTVSHQDAHFDSTKHVKHSDTCEPRDDRDRWR